MAPMLDGIRVVDLTTTFMGPYCTMLLARMGADVVKVEAPGGDVVRHIGRGRNPGMGPVFLAANHGKRSIGLDLKDPAGLAALTELVAGADVFVTNLRPAAVAALGIGPAELAAPGLVYCALPGFGGDGPYRDRAAYDDVVQAACGLAAVQGGDGEPEYVRSVVADKTVALMAVGAICAALVSRERTGAGRVVEVPMFETMASFTLLEQQQGHVFAPPEGPVGYARTASPNRRPYRTADGYLGVVVYTDKQWRTFFDLVGRADLAADPRFGTITGRTEHIDELYGLLAEVLPARTTAEWVETFTAAGIPAQPVLGLDEVLADPHLAATGLLERVEHPSEGGLDLPRLPVTVDGAAAAPVRGAPRLGEHGAEILREAGFADARIEALQRAGTLF
ncbi:CaiB/BaiF CoA-transferase family protein [Pseudonocardia sp. WMMC193]|uniref:CaiB/BaiF CoA transferase family protein n=1 Tax=Pseudonocardia sp. WMMC193 TaxID=2911965 RepID=UPI001F23B445|nr:CoA transferase [Pseudonocardia sp. WMMC193]MCF7550101.1 CoA transferase [Pseudonocardia sp. WMMC193]